MGFKMKGNFVPFRLKTVFLECFKCIIIEVCKFSDSGKCSRETR